MTESPSPTVRGNHAQPKAIPAPPPPLSPAFTLKEPLTDSTRGKEGVETWVSEQEIEKLSSRSVPHLPLLPLEPSLLKQAHTAGWEQGVGTFNCYMEQDMLLLELCLFL